MKRFLMIFVVLMFTAVGFSKGSKPTADDYPLTGSVWKRVVPPEHGHQYTVQVGRDSIGCTAGDTGVFCSQEANVHIQYMIVNGKEYRWELGHGTKDCNYPAVLLRDMTMNEMFNAGAERTFHYKQGKKADEIIIPCYRTVDGQIGGEGTFRITPCGKDGEGCIF